MDYTSAEADEVPDWSKPRPGILFAPGSEVIGTTMLQFWINGDNGPVAALATIQILITVVFVYAVRQLLGVKIYG